MEIELIRATASDAALLWEMQVKAFWNLLDKYQDYETNPASEPMSKVLDRLKMEKTYFYFICADDVKVGAIRVVDYGAERNKKISPLFILPEYRNQGIAQKAIQLCEERHGSKKWELGTILQEKGNCYLYEKMGYRSSGRTLEINEKLTLIFYEK